ncbi:MAG: hypothetical protein SPK90_02955 [Bacteroidales bacterium]|nr:hypothetical protein [Bacteroidales bacterium]MDY6406502.1 hypothetical protein [Bacteroidales bacterium]
MVKGQFITINGERFYEIANYDEMQPFFISLASDTDLWMYLSSTGGLTAGRRSPEEALFPYYTDDKITESYEFTGPKTVIKVKGEPFLVNGELLWKPFSSQQQDVFVLSRKIAKSTVGNQIVFCEENHTLKLRFSYIWAPAGKHGWVRRATLENLGNRATEVSIDDRLQNVLPAGVERKTQNEFSTLVDGYKKTELVPGTSLALFRMEAILVDRAEPSESLTCNTVYGLGLPGAKYDKTPSKGVRGAFVAETSLCLPAHSSQTWYNVLDVSKDAVAVHELMHFIAQPDAIEVIEAAMRESTETLKRIVARNDGVQETGDEANDARHFANVLFNTMRGGYYLTYPPKKGEGEEDLPLTFGRRHGDPSRPWNLFNIRVQDEKGNPVVAYQGNWRDIFQNWEALSLSYPLYINHIIAKFLNSSTADGYNPYRISNEGIDYEVIEPENPWSNIGYWGDHQIIYLLKLLEISYNHRPQELQALLNERKYSFANVPYRLKSYAAIVADPKNSIWFDDEEHKRIQALIPTRGAEAKMLLDDNMQVRLTTMADKLLITLLTKLSNFVPEAGIWMNTLRPEWNDANNALVGYGASMVTLCYMRRYVAFLHQLIQEDVTIGVETLNFLRAIRYAYPNGNTKQFLDIVGTAGETYREKVYAGLSGKTEVLEKEELQEFLDATLCKIDESIRANKRADGLYEAYNLIKFTENESGIEISHLYAMLEGQVAVLSSGLLSGEEAADLLDAMRHSDLYREDQRSYMLYPNRRRKTFLEMNNLPEAAKELPVVQKYLGSILKQDCDGGIHFDAKYRNANELPDELKDLYEQVFNHHAFTGRSGTFYKYEGLGCIYWHMVSKLLLAVGENIQREEDENPSPQGKVLGRLVSHYFAIREGIGSHKNPAEYGAFPFDPYSHTPSMAGAQQPGMTGQVKEDIISRFFELGVSVRDGKITFCPTMLKDTDFVNGELRFTYCGTEIIYSRKSKVESRKTFTLTKEQSAHLFARDGEIKQLIIEL